MRTDDGDAYRARTETASCRNQDLDLFLDGELPGLREARLFQHLHECAACREYLSGALEFRRTSRDESFGVPLWADDKLIARVEAHSRLVQKKTRLHTRDPVWSASTTVSVRTLLLLCGFIIATTYWSTRPADPETAQVYVEQEQVTQKEWWHQAATEVYVFYPGLTIEADRESL